MKKKLILFGTGSFAEVAKCYFDEDSEYDVVAFCADKEYCKSNFFNGLPLIPFDEIENHYPPSKFEMHIAIGYVKLNHKRYMAYNQAKEKGYNLANYINSKIKIWDNNFFGDNLFIFEDNTIQPFVEFGSNIVIWSGNHIGHHSKIGSHSFISSHVVISGHVTIKDFCFFGVNSTIRDSIIIEEKTIVGAGSLILKNTKAEELYIGPKTLPVRLKSTELKKL